MESGGLGVGDVGVMEHGRVVAGRGCGGVGVAKMWRRFCVGQGISRTASPPDRDYGVCDAHRLLDCEPLGKVLWVARASRPCAKWARRPSHKS